MQTRAIQRLPTFFLAIAAQVLLAAGEARAQESALPVQEDHLTIEQVPPKGATAGVAIRQIRDEPPRSMQTGRSSTPAKSRPAVRRQATPAKAATQRSGPRQGGPPPAGRSLALDFGRKSQETMKLPSVREGLGSQISENN